MLIEQFISKRNIKILSNIGEGIPHGPAKLQMINDIYELYVLYGKNIRCRVPDRDAKIKTDLIEGNFGQHLEEVMNYIGTEETCQMARKMIDIIRKQWV